jgi:hypothetical protein
VSALCKGLEGITDSIIGDELVAIRDCCPPSHFVRKTVSQVGRIQFIVMHNAHLRRREIKYGNDKMAMFSILQIKTI